MPLTETVAGDGLPVKPGSENVRFCSVGKMTMAVTAIALAGPVNLALSPMVAAQDIAVYSPDVLDAYPSKNPLAGDPAAIEAGKKLYFKFCIQCHGPKADGTGTVFAVGGANLRKFWRGYPEFVLTVLNGRPKRQMPPWGGYLDEDQISQIGAYLETLAEPTAKWVRQ